MEEKRLDIHSKYAPLFTSDKRYYYVTGGRGSGKSYSVTAFLVNLTYERGHKILFLRYTMTSAHLSIIPQFISVIEDLGLEGDFEINKTEITNKHTGTVIFFKGVKTSSGTQTANLKSITDVTTVVFDEFEEIPDKQTFKKIDYSIRKKGIQNRVIKIQNPSTKNFWGYDEFFLTKRKDTEYIHTTYLDNIENLNTDIINEFDRLKQVNPKEYNNVVLGGWLDKAEGVVFPNWKDGTFDESLSYVYGLDFGFSPDPTAMVKVAIDDKRKLVYVQEEIYKTDLSTNAIEQIVKDRILDKSDLVVADCAEKRLISDLKNTGINITKCKKGAGSIKKGIKDILSYTVIVCGESRNLRKELNNYVWNDRKAGVPIDDFNHLLDAFRYGFERANKSFYAG